MIPMLLDYLRKAKQTQMCYVVFIKMNKTIIISDSSTSPSTLGLP